MKLCPSHNSKSHNSKIVPQSQFKKSQLKKCAPVTIQKVTAQKVCPSHNSTPPDRQCPWSVQTKVQAAYRVSSEFTTVRRCLSFSDYTATPRSRRATAAVSLDRFPASLVCGRASGLGTPTTAFHD